MLLHCYEHLAWHDPVYLVGDEQALTDLRQTITEALRSGKGTCQAFTNDGEGYDVTILCVSASVADQIRLPYTDEVAARKEGIEPWTLG